MLIEFVYSETERVLKKYKTRNPYELLDAIGAITIFSNEYDRSGLKGYSTIMNRALYAVVNGKLREEEKRIAAGHEASHLILHQKEILTSPIKAMRDFNLFDYSGRYEREANSFLADFLVSDDEVLDIILDGGKDYFDAASELFLPAPLLAFKLYSMTQRGHKVRTPVDLDNGFLAR